MDGWMDGENKLVTGGVGFESSFLAGRGAIIKETIVLIEK